MQLFWQDQKYDEKEAIVGRIFNLYIIYSNITSVFTN